MERPGVAQAQQPLPDVQPSPAGPVTGTESIKSITNLAGHDWTLPVTITVKASGI